MLLYGCNLLQFLVIKKSVTLAEKKSHQSHHWMIFGPCNFARPTVGAHPATKPIQLSQPMGRTQPANPTRRPFARVRTDPPLSPFRTRYSAAAAAGGGCRGWRYGERWALAPFFGGSAPQRRRRGDVMAVCSRPSQAAAEMRHPA